MTYMKLGMIRESYTELTKAKELNPELLDARTQLGALFLLSRDRGRRLLGLTAIDLLCGEMEKPGWGANTHNEIPSAPGAAMGKASLRYSTTDGRGCTQP
jgi:hypothetical protein